MSLTSEPLTELAPNIYHKKTTSKDPAASTNPSDHTAVFIFSWMGAPPRAAAKYADGYSSQFASTDVHLITSSVSEWTFGSYESQRQRLSILIPILDALPTESIILAPFSNGGVQKLTLLAEAYKEKHGKPLSARAIVCDSCPGVSDLKHGVPALTAGLSKNPLLLYLANAFMYAFVAASLVVFHAGAAEGPNARGGRLLNDPSLFDTQTPRVYIFSKEDAIVGWRMVLDHTAEALNKGYKVTTEEFQGGQHAAHVRQDQERYWQIIKYM